MEIENNQSVDLQKIINELEALKRAVYKKKSRCTLTTLDRKMDVILAYFGYGVSTPDAQNELAHGWNTFVEPNPLSPLISSSKSSSSSSK